MATADLVTELNKDSFKLEADSEKKLVPAILKLLEDNSNTVQELVVKCLGPLVKKIKDQSISDIADTLCNHLLNEKKGGDELRDIASIGLKTVVTEIPVEPQLYSQILVKRLTPRLITGISMEEKPDIVGYCLEAMNDLLGRFANQMVADHQKILKVVQPQLNSKRMASRKKAIGCLGHLAVTIPEQMFSELVQNLTKMMEDSVGKIEALRTSIQAIGAISRSVGFRLGKFLGEIMPRVLKYIEKNDDELRESCFQCFENLVLRCPKEISPFLDKIIAACLEYIKYDPNYADDEEEEMETDDAEGDDDDDGETYSDDDDMSWKVRRASTKCLSVVISTRSELLGQIYERIAPILIQRFKEREENVKLDIFNCFVDVIKQTNQTLRRHPDNEAVLKPLRELVPKAVAALTKELKAKSLKTRSGCFSVLKEIVLTVRGSLASHFASVVPGIQVALADKGTNSNLKIEALTFLKLSLVSHDPTVFHPHIKTLAPLLNKAMRDAYYRLSSEALQVAAEIVRVLRQDPTATTGFDYKPYINDLVESVMQKLKVQDIDQEVKESSITCAGLMIAHFADELKDKVKAILDVLVDRLGNEITRLTTVKAFEIIAVSPLKVNLSAVLPDVVKTLASFLRQANRALKQSSLTTLNVLVINYGGSSSPAASLFTASVLQELAPLLADSDLHLAHLALNLSASVLTSYADGLKSSSALLETIFPKSLELLKSTLLQGLALDSLMKLFGGLVKVNSAATGYDALLDKILLVGTSDGHKQVLTNAAKCVAAVAVSVDAKVRDNTISKFTKDLSGKGTDVQKQITLYCIGEIGRRVDLTSHSSLQGSILALFESANEDVRQAASFALGNIAIGKLEHYLPVVLSEIKKTPKFKYLLLQSLREIIVRESSTTKGIQTLLAHQGEILPLLFESCENDEEGTRNVVSECLGKITLIAPAQLVPMLVSKLSGSTFTKSCVVASLKFAVVDRPAPEVDTQLTPVMNKFMALLSDSDLQVRRNTLLTINFAAHNKPGLVRQHLGDFLEKIYGESKVKPELIKEVDLGPFKHKVDEGIEIRKAAFETMNTLLDTCLDKVNVSNFITYLVGALNDIYDIKMLGHLILIRLAQVSPVALLEHLDPLVEPLRASVASTAKEGAVKQDVDKNEELIRSSLRAVVAISRIPNVESNAKFEEFMKTSVRSGPLNEKYITIKAESDKGEEMDTK